MENEILEEMLSYIKNMEVDLDGEFGFGRSLEDIIRDDDMPELYTKICNLLSYRNQ